MITAQARAQCAAHTRMRKRGTTKSPPHTTRMRWQAGSVCLYDDRADLSFMRSAASASRVATKAEAASAAAGGAARTSASIIASTVTAFIVTVRAGTRCGGEGGTQSLHATRVSQRLWRTPLPTASTRIQRSREVIDVLEPVYQRVLCGPGPARSGPMVK